MEYTDQYQVEEVEPYQAWEVENLRLVCFLGLVSVVDSVILIIAVKYCFIT